MNEQTELLPQTAYSTWTPAEQASADRMEAEYNGQRSAILAQAAAAQGHPITTATDSMLVSLAKTYRRDLEDVEDGSLTGGEKRARMLRAKLHDIECEQDVRAALAESWLASEDGTHCYSAFSSRGGLAGVMHDGATPPSYQLATFLDHARHLRGLSTVLDWGRVAER